MYIHTYAYTYVCTRMHMNEFIYVHIYVYKFVFYIYDYVHLVKTFSPIVHSESRISESSEIRDSECLIGLCA
jgi:hypothetical protein